jgi:hypothetical protein
LMLINGVFHEIQKIIAHSVCALIPRSELDFPHAKLEISH